MNHSDYLRLKIQVEDHLLAFLPEIDCKSSSLYDSIKYSLMGGGKRIRPILLLAACEFCGHDSNSAIPYACAIEYIHTYSLIHDDLPAMDDDDLRRGLPTNHKIYGEGVAILAGDGLLTSAFELMSKDMLLYFDDSVALKRRIGAAYEITKSAGCRGMVAGQVTDIEAEGKICSKELLDYIHLNKTAALLIAAVKAGGLLGGGDFQQQKDLASYAECIGLGFQIADDLLDIYGDEALTGKASGKDDILKRCTYPTVYGIPEAKEKLKELTDKAIAVMEPYYDDGEFFIALAKDLSIRIK